MAEKLNFMVFKTVFFFWSTYPTKLLEEKTKQLKIIKKSIIAAQKSKQLLVAGSIKEFLISCWPKILKKSSLSKLLLLQDHIEQNVRIGGFGELLFSSSEIKYFSI